MPESEIRLPDVGEGIAQAEVVQWHVAVGDHLAEDQPFVDVMTDKATVELPSPFSGVVTRLSVGIGELVAVGAPLLWIDIDDGASVPETGDTAQVHDEAAGSSADVAADVPVGAAARPSAGRSTARTPIGEAAAPKSLPRAAPAVRRRAADLGIDLADVAGSGASGRVVHADLDALLAVSPLGPRSFEDQAAAEDRVERIKLTGLRRNISRRMQEAHRIPHFSYVEQVNVGELEQLRKQLNEEHVDTRPHLTMLPFLMRAVARAIADFPQMNARYDGDTETLERHSAVHLGIATQAPNGLMVPVVRNADQNGLWRNATEVRRLADAALDGTIKLADLTGSTITITSLGALGGLMSTPIINAPEVAIIGVNRIVEQPALIDGQLQLSKLMNLSSSFDHRVIDGWDAARFIHRIKALLENPALLFLDE